MEEEERGKGETEDIQSIQDGDDDKDMQRFLQSQLAELKREWQHHGADRNVLEIEEGPVTGSQAHYVLPPSTLEIPAPGRRRDRATSMRLRSSSVRDIPMDPVATHSFIHEWGIGIDGSPQKEETGSREDYSETSSSRCDGVSLPTPRTPTWTDTYHKKDATPTERDQDLFLFTVPEEDRHPNPSLTSREKQGARRAVAREVGSHPVRREWNKVLSRVPDGSSPSCTCPQPLDEPLHVEVDETPILPKRNIAIPQLRLLPSQCLADTRIDRPVGKQCWAPTTTTTLPARKRQEKKFRARRRQRHTRMESTGSTPLYEPRKYNKRDRPASDRRKPRLMTTSAPPSKGLVILAKEFFANPMEVRQFALEQKFSHYAGIGGARTRSFQTREMKQSIERVVGRPIRSSTSLDESGFFHYILDGPLSPDTSWLHQSRCAWKGIVFLTPLSESDGRLTESAYPPALTLSSGKAEEKSILSESGSWKITEKISQCFNLLLLIRGSVSSDHAQWREFETHLLSDRLTMLFFFDTL